jgi:hypothetical protein
MSKTKQQLAIDRFWRFVEIKENGCWIWIARRSKDGYGQFWDGDKPVYAHRWLYERCVGQVPKGKELGHVPECHNRACVNFLHVRPITHLENYLERWSEGTIGNIEIKSGQIFSNAAKTHCPEGHRYSRGNTIKRKNGSRECRICVRAKRKEWLDANPKNREKRKQWFRRNWARTKAEKNAKRNTKYRAENPVPQPITHCHKGHALVEGNVYLSKSGRRNCRACHKEAQTAYTERRKSLSA